MQSRLAHPLQRTFPRGWGQLRVALDVQRSSSPRFWQHFATNRLSALQPLVWNFLWLHARLGGCFEFGVALWVSTWTNPQKTRCSKANCLDLSISVNANHRATCAEDWAAHLSYVGGSIPLAGLASQIFWNASASSLEFFAVRLQAEFPAEWNHPTMCCQNSCSK